MDKYAEQALLEYSSEECMVHPGGVDGRAYWNISSSQFMFAPKFYFPKLPKGRKFRYTAKDKNGELHTFVADNAEASLAPIWAELPVAEERMELSMGMSESYVPAAAEGATMVRVGRGLFVKENP